MIKYWATMLFFALMGNTLLAKDVVVTLAKLSRDWQWTINKLPLAVDDEGMAFTITKESLAQSNKPSLRIKKNGDIEWNGLLFLENLWTEKELVHQETGAFIEELGDGEELLQIFSREGGDVVVQDGHLVFLKGKHRIHGVSRYLDLRFFGGLASSQAVSQRSFTILNKTMVNIGAHLTVSRLNDEAIFGGSSEGFCDTILNFSENRTYASLKVMGHHFEDRRELAKSKLAKSTFIELYDDKNLCVGITKTGKACLKLFKGGKSYMGDKSRIGHGNATAFLVEKLSANHGVLAAFGWDNGSVQIIHYPAEKKDSIYHWGIDVESHKPVVDMVFNEEKKQFGVKSKEDLNFTLYDFPQWLLERLN